jgi:demethylmenaquinone methyltransferase / 2-methoxy-6-polyprenyl-1,4-benzoquinol methylase
VVILMSLFETDPRLERVHRFFSGTGLTYDRMVHYTTFGIDGRWKKRIVDLIPAHAGRVLDLACGTGILTLAIAKRYPHCHVIGVELRDEYLSIAQRKVREERIQNVEFVLSRAEDYRSLTPFDCIVSSYLAKYAHLKRLTANAGHMLNDQGLILMHDFMYPPNPLLVGIWRLYFWLLQRVGSRLFPAWREIYSGLPELIEETRWLAELPEALTEEQFSDIRLEYLTLYGSAIVTAKKGLTTTATAPARCQGA